MSEPHPPELPDERDAWLHQALRHAPDLATAPPHALREAILAEARSAVQARARRTAEPSLLAHAAAFWSWLARPPVAAGFASVMAATLVGLMWWDRPMDETARPAPMSSSRVVESSPALPALPLAPAQADTPVLSPPAAVPQTAAAPAPAPADVATSRRASAAPAKTAPAAIDAEKVRKDEPAPQSVSPASPFPGNGVGESSELAGPLRDERRQALPSVAKKAQGESPSDAQVSGNLAALAKPASPARERAAIARRDTAGATGPAGSADALSAGAAAAPQAFAAAPPAAPAAPARVLAPERESLKSAAKTSPRPMAPLMASIAQDAARWSRHGASGSQPLAASTQAWLADVDTAAAGRWQATDESAARAELPAPAPAFAVRLDRDGRAAALIRIDDAGVFFRQETGAAWFAPLPADTIARLRATLPP